MSGPTASIPSVATTGLYYQTLAVPYIPCPPAEHDRPVASHRERQPLLSPAGSDSFPRHRNEELPLIAEDSQADTGAETETRNTPEYQENG